jgi:hypothetical protein
MRRLGSIIAVAGVLAACGSPTPTATPSGSALATTPAITAAPSSSIESPSGAPTGSSALIVDGALLDHLPATIDGVQRRDDPETAAQIAADPVLTAEADRLAVALYVGPIPTDTVLDYAVATVVRPRPGIMDDEWFRSWRETFDEGVCAQAGGVDLGRSEYLAGGRTVYRSTCAGGVTIYHTHLPGSGLVVSVQGTGPAELGRAIVEGATE